MMTVPAFPRETASPAAQRLVRMTEALEQLVLCEENCLRCAHACLKDPAHEELAACIAATLRCAEECGVTALRILKHPSVTPDLQLHLCADTCNSCAACCENLPGLYRPLCVTYCRACQQACVAFALTGPAGCANN